MGAVTVLQLIDSGTGSFGQQLITHTDATDGSAAFRQLTLQHIHRFDTTVWIAGAIGQEQAVELHISIVVVPGHTDDLATTVDQTTDDILLDTAVDKNHLTPCPLVVADDIAATDTLHPVDGTVVFLCRLLLWHSNILNAFELQPTHHHTMLTQHLRQGTGVDAGHTGYVLTLQPVAQRLACIPVVVLLAIVTHDDGRGINLVTLHESGEPVGLNTERRHTIVAHQRIGKHQHLAGIAGVGERLGITHHGSIEHHLTCYGLLIPEALSLESCSVLQDECYISHFIAFSLFAIGQMKNDK